MVIQLLRFQSSTLICPFCSLEAEVALISHSVTCEGCNRPFGFYVCQKCQAAQPMQIGTKQSCGHCSVKFAHYAGYGALPSVPFAALVGRDPSAPGDASSPGLSP
jgi:hypothetical protein